MSVTISEKEYNDLLHNTVLLDLYRDACDQSDYPKYLYKCSFHGCEAMCLRDSCDYDGYYKCESMETCVKCDESFCNLHLDGWNSDWDWCKQCVKTINKRYVE